jgi:hypothetical protein
VRRVSRETVVKFAWSKDCLLRPVDRMRFALIRQRVGTAAAPIGPREASGLSLKIVNGVKLVVIPFTIMLDRVVFMVYGFLIRFLFMYSKIQSH